MGQFSWISKNGEQIRCENHRGQRVWMTMRSNDKSTVVVCEEQYEGYGEFGGIDYYEALYEMNHDKIRNISYLEDSEQKREVGIDLVYGNSEIDFEGSVEFPQLFTIEPTQQVISKIDWTIPCNDDPNQGWDVEDEDEDDNW